MTEKTYATIREALEHPNLPGPTVMKIGGTTYEIHTHWNTDGRQTMLEQLMALILNADTDDNNAA